MDHKVAKGVIEEEIRERKEVAQLDAKRGALIHVLNLLDKHAQCIPCGIKLGIDLVELAVLDQGREQVSSACHRRFQDGPALRPRRRRPRRVAVEVFSWHSPTRPFRTYRPNHGPRAPN